MKEKLLKAINLRLVALEDSLKDIKASKSDRGTKETLIKITQDSIYATEKQERDIQRGINVEEIAKDYKEALK